MLTHDRAGDEIENDGARGHSGDPIVIDATPAAQVWPQIVRVVNAMQRLGCRGVEPCEIDRADHAACVHGCIASRRSICSSDKSASSACRQPVLRRMWIASARDGTRLLLNISLA